MTFKGPVEADNVRGTNIARVDVDFPIIIRTTGANIPTLTTLQGNLSVPQWAVNDLNMCESQELIHGRKEGSAIYRHLHMITNGQEAVDKFVRWELEYSWINVNGQLQTNTTVQTEVTIPADTPDKTMLIVSLTNFTPTGGKIAGHLIARLRRVASVGTAPLANPWCGMLQAHIQCDTVGSRTIQAK